MKQYKPIKVKLWIIILYFVALIALFLGINFWGNSQAKADTEFSQTFLATSENSLLYISTNSTYSLAHDNTVGTIQALTGDGNRYWVGQGGTYTVYRNKIQWDTSELPENSVVDNYVVSLYSSIRTGSDFTLCLVNGNNLSFDSNLPADYGFMLTSITSYGSYATINGWDIGYVDLIGNTAGLASISKTGFTQFGLRSLDDINNVNDTAYVYYYNTTKGTGYEPKLTVYYHYLPAAEATTIETQITRILALILFIIVFLIFMLLWRKGMSALIVTGYSMAMSYYMFINNWEWYYYPIIVIVFLISIYAFIKYGTQGEFV